MKYLYSNNDRSVNVIAIAWIDQHEVSQSQTVISVRLNIMEKFNRLLERRRNECINCDPGKGGKIYCTTHNNLDDVSRTSLLDFNITVGTFVNVRQEIHTSVYCTFSQNCKKVRKTFIGPQLFEFLLDLNFLKIAAERYFRKI